METITFVLDGSNLAALDKSRGHSLDTIEDVRRALQKAYPGCHVVTLVDASLRHRVERAAFDEQEARGLLFSAPADEDADFFILKFARRRSAVVVTTDRYIGQAARVGVPLLRPMLADGEVILGEPRVFRNVRGRRSEPFDLASLTRPGSEEPPPPSDQPGTRAASEPSAAPARKTGAGRGPRRGPRRAPHAESDTAAPDGGSSSSMTTTPSASAGAREPRTESHRPTPSSQATAPSASATGRTAASPRSGRRGRSRTAARSWRDEVGPAVRRIRRGLSLRTAGGRARSDQGRAARLRRYAWLQDVLHAARHVGLADAGRRHLLLAGIPQAVRDYLEVRYAPEEQLAFDVCVLAHLPRVESNALLPLSIWLRNAHVLSHPLRLSHFFVEAMEQHEKAGCMPAVWLPFPEVPYEGVDSSAWRRVHVEREVEAGAGAGQGDEEPSGGAPRAETTGTVEHRTEEGPGGGGEDGASTGSGEVCPYCGRDSLPVLDYYLGRSCSACFLEREERLQAQREREQASRKHAWPEDEWLEEDWSLSGGQGDGHDDAAWD